MAVQGSGGAGTVAPGVLEDSRGNGATVDVNVDVEVGKLVLVACIVKLAVALGEAPAVGDGVVTKLKASGVAEGVEDKATVGVTIGTLKLHDDIANALSIVTVESLSN